MARVDAIKNISRNSITGYKHYDREHPLSSFLSRVAFSIEVRVMVYESLWCPNCLSVYSTVYSDPVLILTLSDLTPTLFLF